MSGPPQDYLENFLRERAVEIPVSGLARCLKRRLPSKILRCELWKIYSSKDLLRAAGIFSGFGVDADLGPFIDKKRDMNFQTGFADSGFHIIGN